LRYFPLRFAVLATKCAGKLILKEFLVSSPLEHIHEAPDLTDGR
jgi:hypothetical protein